MDKKDQIAPRRLPDHERSTKIKVKAQLEMFQDYFFLPDSDSDTQGLVVTDIEYY